MKHIASVSLIVFLTISNVMLYGQDKCKVLMPSISKTYEGKCKNGLANGKGIAEGTDRYEGQFSKGLPGGEGKYTWADGSTYSGEWVEGMRHGIGKYTMILNGKDSVQDGLWQRNNYRGAKPAKPFVSYNSGVDRYSFKKSPALMNRVLIDFYQNGARNKKISNLLMTSSSGQDISYGILYGYDNVDFPVTIKISYTTPNKMNSSMNNMKFDFVIYEPGDWTIELFN